MAEKIAILQIGPCLLVTIQEELQDQSALVLQDELTRKVSESGARGVVIDISSLSIIDSFMGRVLGSLASTSRILDAETVVVGMQAAVAITLVELGITLPGVLTAMNVEKGMDLLKERLVSTGDDNDSDGYTD